MIIKGNWLLGKYRNFKILNSLKALYEFLDICDEGVQNLSTLGLERNILVDLILIYIIQSKLDNSLKKDWELHIDVQCYPSYDELIAFLEKYARSLANLRLRETSKTSPKPNKVYSHATSVSRPNSNTACTPCMLCKNSHLLSKCQLFRDKSLQERWRFGLCYNCLRSNHLVYACKLTAVCGVCKQRHHTLLHAFTSESHDSNSLSGAIHAVESSNANRVDSSVRSNVNSSARLNAVIQTHSINHSSSSSQILLSTALIRVNDLYGNSCMARALIDTGSQRTLITDSLRKTLNLPVNYSDASMYGIGDNCLEKPLGEVDITFSPHYSNTLFTVKNLIETIKGKDSSSKGGQFLSSIHTDATIANNIISLTKICLCMNTFTYSHTHFKQIRGTPMGSPLSSILSEITMSTIDQWICNRQPSNIFFWRRYVDDIFCVCKTDSENTIFTDLHTYNPNITFTLEREHELVIPFLDVLVIRTPNTYHTTVYYKKNHPPRYTHYRSHCSTSHKINIVKALTRRLLTHCSLPIFKTIEKNRIISHLTISGFPLSFIEKHTYSPVPLNPPATYKSTCVIPFSPLSVNLSRFLKPFGIRTSFTNTPNLHSLLRHPITKTDSSTDPLTSSGAVYSVSCQQCPATYVGETGRTIAIRMTEHTRNITNRDTRSLIFQHIASSGHSFDTANPTIHYKNISNLHQRLVLESIVSSKLHSINRKIDIPAAYTNYI
ncbi:hypothetical protein LAZ67_X002951 [Cordylochernes scorpioides]|uniref:Peptidase A2 domain-containing protein n=1 Tax=Cordylochernes scorpioides TaxID=51811 RepID=A0ABY6LXY8_9ARAC|nr:hypothetical protein LAZ67_X002951 [Cordylochernes scorpioides]